MTPRDGMSNAERLAQQIGNEQLGKSLDRALRAGPTLEDEAQCLDCGRKAGTGHREGCSGNHPELDTPPPAAEETESDGQPRSTPPTPAEHNAYRVRSKAPQGASERSELPDDSAPVQPSDPQAGAEEDGQAGLIVAFRPGEVRLELNGLPGLEAQATLPLDPETATSLAVNIMQAATLAQQAAQQLAAQGRTPGGIQLVDGMPPDLPPELGGRR